MIINIGIIGFGTVGRGFCELLLQKGDQLKEQFDLEYRVIAVSDRSLGTVYCAGGLDLVQMLSQQEKKMKFTHHCIDLTVFDLIADLHVDVWCELTNTNLQHAFPAIDHIRHALGSGKHVITTNKGPAFLHYRELQELAEIQGVEFLIEGTVMAGTPVINLLNGPLTGCRITGIKGILNGTTNFMLSEMENGLDYEEALSKARQLGYAEADPVGDVDGLDAMAKVKILSNLILEKELDPPAIYREGIRGITREDIIRASNLNKRWKLIGCVEDHDSIPRAYVRPEMLDLDHPLASVNGNMNAITFTTDLLGDVTIIGPGAGKKETGYAVLNGLIRVNEAKGADKIKNLPGVFIPAGTSV